MDNDSYNEDNWLYGDSNAEISEPSKSDEPNDIKNVEDILPEDKTAQEMHYLLQFYSAVDHNNSIKMLVLGRAWKSDPEVIMVISTYKITSSYSGVTLEERVTNGKAANDCAPLEDAQEEATEPLEDTDELPPAVEPDEHKESIEKSEEEEYEDFSDEDSDDNITVVIRDIKSGPINTPFNFKRPGVMQTASGVNKLKQNGKFSINDFESVESINGVQQQDFNLDAVENKPWRKPGADITDYFNYGFNEDTWQAYCERIKKMRVQEAGVRLAPTNIIEIPRALSNITNENSKYSCNILGFRKAGPPPSQRVTGSIDVIGSNLWLASNRHFETHRSTSPKENVIQVITADKREYGKKLCGLPDMSVPPPVSSFHSTDLFEPCYGRYEPTQASQWCTNPNWTPSAIRELTPAPEPITPLVSNSSMGPPAMVRSRSIYTAGPSDSHHQEEYEREESCSEKPDGHRERSHRRDKSRSRSHRHKCKSKSHRKKKSRRHAKDESD